MSFADGFIDGTKINTAHSSNYFVDPRGLVTPTRSQGTSYLSDDMNDSGNWVNIHNGTGSVSWITSAHGSSLNAVNLTTGLSTGSQAGAQRILSYLPVSYGYMIMVWATGITTNTNDALELDTQSTVDNSLLRIVYKSDGLFVYDSVGTLHQLSNHYEGDGWCEWWVENHRNGDGTNTVTAYGGTQKLSSATITLPTGSSGNAGLVMGLQSSGTTANLTSAIGQWNIGITQLSDAMTLVGSGYNETLNGNPVNILVLYEDVCADTVINTDLNVSIAVGTSLTWNSVTMTSLGVLGAGSIDPTKNVYVFGGNFTFNSQGQTTIESGWPVQYKIDLAAGKLGAVIGVIHQLVTN